MAAAEATGVEMIAMERVRQVSQEGWTPEHDDEHYMAELTRAAKCYADRAFMQVILHDIPKGTPPQWPWDASWWKPSPDPIRNLVKAGALIAAEIDRLQRNG